MRADEITSLRGELIVVPGIRNHITNDFCTFDAANDDFTKILIVAVEVHSLVAFKSAVDVHEHDFMIAISGFSSGVQSENRDPVHHVEGGKSRVFVGYLIPVIVLQVDNLVAVFDGVVFNAP